MPKLDFAPARQQDCREADCAADSGADARAFPASVGQAAEGSAAACQDGDVRGIVAVAGTLLDCVLTMVYLLPGLV